MSFVKLNGCVAPIADGSTKRDSEAFAKDAESLFNNQIPRFTEHKDSFALALQKSSAEVSNSFAGLINGEGAHWPLTTHLWSSNGYGPEAGFTVAVIGGANPFGVAGYMSTTDVTFDVGLSELWTIMVWRLEGASWTHYLIRADGVKFVDGARNDASPTTWLTTGNQRFALGGAPTGFSHLTFLPYLLDTDCAPETYRWQTAQELQAYWPMDGNANDISGSHNGVPSSVTFITTGGQVGGFAELNNVADTITVADDPDLTPLDADPFSFELWLRSSTPAVSAQIVQKGLFSGAGYGFILSAAGELEWAVFGSVSGFRSVKCEPPFDGEWHHLVGTYDGLSKISMFCDGVLVASDVATTTGIDSTGDDLVFGGIVSDIDDSKFFRSELSAAEVLEHYVCGLYRRQLPIQQPWSALPDIDLFGEISACQQLLVNGSTGKEKTLSYGGANGWTNNNRQIPFTLEVK